MSAEAMGWVYRYSPYDGVTFAVHLAIGDSANDQYDHEFWMRQEKLAKKARTTRPTVNAAVRRLLDDGMLLDLDPPLADDPKARRYRPRRFRFLFVEGLPVIYDARGGVSTDDKGVSAQTTPGVSTDDTEPKGTQGEPKSNKRGTSFPEAFFVTEPMREWYAANTPTADLKVETAQFADYHRAKGDTAKDWVASWRTWMRNAVKFQNQRAGRRSPGSPPPVDPDRGIITDRSEAGPVTQAWLYGEAEPEVGQA